MNLEGDSPKESHSSCSTVTGDSILRTSISPLSTPQGQRRPTHDRTGTNKEVGWETFLGRKAKSEQLLKRNPGLSPCRPSLKVKQTKHQLERSPQPDMGVFASNHT
ncbi:hypothetical protein ACRRTK_024029 [Alexandromys fortis]